MEFANSRSPPPSYSYYRGHNRASNSNCEDDIQVPAHVAHFSSFMTPERSTMETDTEAVPSPGHEAFPNTNTHEPSIGPVPPHSGHHDTIHGAPPPFDIFEWYPKYQSCQRYFVNHAQVSTQVQALAAFINIRLPSQRSVDRVLPAATQQGTSLPDLGSNFHPTDAPIHESATSVSLIPYIRRLIITGLDSPGILHGFFGEDWIDGCGPLHEQERRNYLFAAKSGGWASVRRAYDINPFETVPYLRPLQAAEMPEIEAAERNWSEWLAMEDWMIGPRTPAHLSSLPSATMHGSSTAHHQHESQPTHTELLTANAGVTAGQCQA